MQRSAFTLLETTLVMTIAGLTMALAVPRLNAARDSAAVHSALSELGALFSLARQTALNRRTPVALRFDPRSATVELRIDGHPVVRREIGLAYGIALAANRDSALYDPRGVGYGVSNLTVIISRGKAADTLTMSRLGRTRW